MPLHPHVSIIDFNELIPIVKDIEQYVIGHVEVSKDTSLQSLQSNLILLQIKRFYRSMQILLTNSHIAFGSFINTADIKLDILDFIDRFDISTYQPQNDENFTILIIYAKLFQCIASLYHQHSTEWKYEDFSLCIHAFLTLNQFGRQFMPTHTQFNTVFKSFIQNLDKEMASWLLTHIQHSLTQIYDNITHDVSLKELHFILIVLKDTIEFMDPSILYQVLGTFSGEIIIQITHLIDRTVLMKGHDEEIDVLMVMILFLFIEEKFVHISPRIMGAILGCIQLYITETRNISLNMFLSCYHIILSSLKYRQFQSLNNIVEIQKNIVSLIQQTIKMRQPKHEMVCAQNISRIYQELSTNKTLMKQFGVYMIIDYIKITESESIQFEVRNTLNNGICSIIDEIEEKELSIVMKNMNELGKTMIKQIYEKYKNEFKFDGKV